ncbi:Scd6-like Sm domain-containing protein, partial [Jimgerdemannia flammicorona]
MSGVGYIGSKISLISRSDIRYVGILHNINSQDSTVALEQVRSYGTEGRRGNPAEEIPQSDNVFEYIVFRGSDVKDLQVFEPPAPAPVPAPQVPNDPAILGTTAPRPPSFQPYAQPPLGYPPINPYLMPQPYQQPAQYWPAPAFPPQQPQHPQQQVHVMDDVSKSVAKETETVTQQKDQTTLAKPELKSQPAVQLASSSQSAASGSRPAQTAVVVAKTEVTTAAVEQLAKKVSELSMTREYPKENSIEAGRGPASNRLPGMGGHLVQQNFNRRGNRGSNNRRSNNTMFNDNRNRVTIPQSDFDFESANA